MTSRTGNPYRLPTRLSFWREFLRETSAAGDDGFCWAEEPEDIATDTPHRFAFRSAEEVAAVAYEVADAPGTLTRSEVIDLAASAAENWLLMLDQSVNDGRTSPAVASLVVGARGLAREREKRYARGACLSNRFPRPCW